MSSGRSPRESLNLQRGLVARAEALARIDQVGAANRTQLVERILAEGLTQLEQHCDRMGWIQNPQEAKSGQDDTGVEQMPWPSRDP